MTEKSKSAPQIVLTQDQLMELANLVIEMHALYRIFEHAACDKSDSADASKRVYQDIASLLRPLCLRLDRLQHEITTH